MYIRSWFVREKTSTLECIREQQQRAMENFFHLLMLVREFINQIEKRAKQNTAKLRYNDSLSMLSHVRVKVVPWSVDCCWCWYRRDCGMKESKVKGKWCQMTRESTSKCHTFLELFFSERITFCIIGVLFRPSGNKLVNFACGFPDFQFYVDFVLTRLALNNKQQQATEWAWKILNFKLFSRYCKTGALKLRRVNVSASKK